MPPSHQPKELLQLVDTSSQVSIEMAETSLEEMPASISPIVATSRSESITLPADAVELHANANKALKELLTTKASIDTCRQRAIWELGMELCRNKSKATKSIKEAKAICSQANLDAQALCFATVKETKAICSHATLEAKAICLETVKETKMTHTGSIQENKAAFSMAIRDAEATRPPRLSYCRRNMATSCRTWRGKSSKMRSGVRPTSSLLARLLCAPAQWHSRMPWQLPTTFY